MAVLLAGIAMVMTSASAAVSAASLLELAAGCAIVVASSLVVAEPRLASMLTAGEVAVDAAFVYFAMSAWTAGPGGVPSARADSQFVIALVGLAFSTALLSLASPVGRSWRAHLAVIVRDGVVLVVGTLLLAIALSEVTSATLQPPHWNWVSFVMFTLVGMSVVMLGEAALFTHRRTGADWVTPWLGSAQLLLVIGLTIMIYGSYNNLTLGTTGLSLSFNAVVGGVGAWLVAAAVMAIGYGALRRNPRQAGRLPWRRELVYVGAALGFVYGERTVMSGAMPAVHVGSAFPVGFGVGLLAVLLLAVVRPAVQMADPAG
jgi:hypothetical protein